MRIEFLGHEKGKGPKPYKNFEVQYREVEDPAVTGAKEAFKD